MNPENFSCTLADGLKTRCHGIYLALSGAGKQQTITAEQALDREMKGLPWTTGMLETAAGKAARAKAQQLASAQQAAKEAAELKALADEKLAQEEKAAAELKAQQEKEEEEKKQKIEERKRKRQERLENRPWLVKLLSPE